MALPRATWWAQLTEGVNYYRAELPARFLPGQINRIQYHAITDQHLAPSPWAPGRVTFPSQEGAAIWMFPGTSAAALMIRGMQTQGFPVLVEVDDLYFVPPPVEGMSEWIRRMDATGRASYEVHGKIARFVDAVTVSTPALAREYLRVNRNVFVCPNAIDPLDWDSQPVHQPDGVLRIGWAASDSHQWDSTLIDRALSWASRQDGVEIVIMGITAVNWTFPHRHIEFKPMNEYRDELQNIDVMLCPLKAGRWADCKSDIKAVEAAMAGACSIVSRAEPYRPWFDGPALTADSPKEFLKCVRHLVRHPEEARDMAAKAKEYVLKERSFPDAIAPWQEAMEFVESPKVAA